MTKLKAFPLFIVFERVEHLFFNRIDVTLLTAPENKLIPSQLLCVDEPITLPLVGFNDINDLMQGYKQLLNTLVNWLEEEYSAFIDLELSLSNSAGASI